MKKVVTFAEKKKKEKDDDNKKYCKVRDRWEIIVIIEVNVEVLCT